MLSFHVKFVQTERRTDRRTTVKQYAPIFRYGGIRRKSIPLENDHGFYRLQGSFNLTLCQTIPTFNDPEKEPFENNIRKGENAGNQHFLLFPCFLPFPNQISVVQ